MQEASSASTDPAISPPTMSQSSSNISSSIPNSQFYSNSDNHNSLNAETHNSRFASSLADLITENENKDLKANLLHRASVVANTPIRYEKNQLLILIHEHLVLSGLNKTAELLKNESGIFSLVDISGSSDPPVSPVITGTTTPSDCNQVNSPTKTFIPATPTPTVCSAVKANLMDQVVDIKHKVSLSSIVADYLSSQHALCESPMTTIPKFDLLHPHKCPGQRSSIATAPNFTARYSKKGLFPTCGGGDGSKMDRKLVYSRYRPVKSLAVLDDEYYSSCTFSRDKILYAGTSEGSVQRFNLQSSQETNHQVHHCGDSVNHLMSSNDSTLLITSSSLDTYSKLWSVGGCFVMKKKFKEAYLEFSHLVQDKLVGTLDYGVATVYDLQTGQLTRTLKPTTSNGYRGNKATFDPTDSLILSDGVLWDYRAPRHLHCFDKLNQTLTDIFHPNGLEIISNTEVWDIRTFHLLRTVPELDQCQVKFNYGGEVIIPYFEKESEIDSNARFLTSFKTFDSSDYSLIATIDTKTCVAGLCTSWDDCYLAVNEESTVRLYDVGRPSTDKEDQDDRPEEDSSGA